MYTRFRQQIDIYSQCCFLVFVSVRASNMNRVACTRQDAILTTHDDFPRQFDCDSHEWSCSPWIRLLPHRSLLLTRSEIEGDVLELVSVMNEGDRQFIICRDQDGRLIKFPYSSGLQVGVTRAWVGICVYGASARALVCVYLFVCVCV